MVRDVQSHEIEAAGSRKWEAVEIGEALPVLVFPITVKTLVLAVCGTRDVAPYHHDRAYSQSLGNPDMFVNTMFEQALFARFVTDWSGPESDFRETTLAMTGVLCPGDVAKIEGRVADKSKRDGDHRVTIDMTVSNGAGVLAKSSATIAMPSDVSGPVVPRTSLAKPVIEPDPDIPDFAKAWLGEPSPPSWGGYPISEVQIMYWCDMVEDANPLYVAGDYARKSRHGGVIAPPMGLISWAFPRANHIPDANCKERALWPPVEAGQEPSVHQPPGVGEVIVQSSHQTYGKPLRPGDRAYFRSEVVNCSPRKETRVGPGYFQTALYTYYNQNDEIVGTDVLSMLWYGTTQ